MADTLVLRTKPKPKPAQHHPRPTKTAPTAPFPRTRERRRAPPKAAVTVGRREAKDNEARTHEEGRWEDTVPVASRSSFLVTSHIKLTKTFFTRFTLGLSPSYVFYCNTLVQYSFLPSRLHSRYSFAIPYMSSLTCLPQIHMLIPSASARIS